MFQYNSSLCDGGITVSFKKFLLYFLLLSLIRDCFSVIINSDKYNPFLCEGGIIDFSKNLFYIFSYFVSYEIDFQQSSTKSNGITFYLCLALSIKEILFLSFLYSFLIMKLHCFQLNWSLKKRSIPTLLDYSTCYGYIF